MLLRVTVNQSVFHSRRASHLLQQTGTAICTALLNLVVIVWWHQSDHNIWKDTVL